MNNSIPNKIWLLWFQGLDEASYLVQKCVESWKRENPTWEVIVLDNNNIDKYVDTTIFENELSKLPLPKKSNLIRLQLLEQYGGVWADTTTYCTRPLDDWIHEAVAPSGFFAFHKPGRDRIMANWFMASRKNSLIISKIKEVYILFFTENNFSIDNEFKKKLIKDFCKILNRTPRTTTYWLSPFFTKILKIYPYYIFHYMFYKLVTTDSECKNIWDNTKKISADGPHKILRHGANAPLNDIIKQDIDEKITPVYKLAWKKYKHWKYIPSSTLHYLLEIQNRD